jgi:hypothetical protein
VLDRIDRVRGAGEGESEGTSQLRNRERVTGRTCPTIMAVAPMTPLYAMGMSGLPGN